MEDIDFTVRQVLLKYRLKYGRDPPKIEVHPQAWLDMVTYYNKSSTMYTPFKGGSSSGGASVYGVPIVLSKGGDWARRDRNGCYQTGIKTPE